MTTSPGSTQRIAPPSEGLRLRAGFLDVWMHAIAATTGEYAVQAEIEPASPLDEVRLRQAVAAVISQEPILACRLRVEGRRGQWEPIPGEYPVPLAIAHTRPDYERLHNEPLRSDIGPQIAVTLWRGGTTDRLRVKVAHQVADAGGLKVILRRLSEAYSSPGEAASPETARQPADRGGCGRVLRSIPRGAYPAVLRDILTSIAREVVLKRSFLHPPVEVRPDALCEYVVRTLDAERVSWLREFGRQRGATLNDLFLTAIWRALWRTGNRSKHTFAMVMNIDLRQWYDAAREEGVTNLVSAEVIRQDADPGADFEATLARVTRWSTRRKTHVLGIANLLIIRTWIKALPFENLRESERRRHDSGQALPVFTNLGSLEAADLDFGGLGVRSAVLLPPARMDGRMFGLSGFDGSLSLAAGVPAPARQAIESLFDAVFAELPSTAR